MRNSFDHSDILKLSPPRARNEVFVKLAQIPDIQLIFVAALACTRHRGTELVALQRQGVLSYLLLDAIDLITGDYITKAKEAAAQIAEERKPSGIILMCGCQSALLSTDYGLLTGEMEQELGIPVRVYDGCRLCGFEQEETDGGSVNLDLLAYNFIPPAAKSENISVNLIGDATLAEENELLGILKDAKAESINSLSACKNIDDYHKMGAAQLNIITSASQTLVGEYLQDKLGIDYVCLDGVYDGQALCGEYQKLAQALACDIDVSSFKSRLDEKLVSAKSVVLDRPIAVEGNSALAKWLISEGFNVESLSMGHKQTISREEEEWFKVNAPGMRIAGIDVRGGGSGGNNHEGRSGGTRPGGRGGNARNGGRPNGQKSSGGLLIGFAGSMHYLEMLEKGAQGGRQF